MKPNNQHLIRVIYSLWDFQQALSALTFLLEECDFRKKYTRVELRRFRCYETTLIISMARPFENSRSGSTLSIKSLAIRLDSQERKLMERVMHLRRKIVAHSDEDEMHFVSSSFPILEEEPRFPNLQFNEGLHLNEGELYELNELLRKLISGVAAFVFKLAQKYPDSLVMTKMRNGLANYE